MLNGHLSSATAWAKTVLPCNWACREMYMLAVFLLSHAKSRDHLLSWAKCFWDNLNVNIVVWKELSHAIKAKITWELLSEQLRVTCSLCQSHCWGFVAISRGTYQELVSARFHAKQCSSWSPFFTGFCSICEHSHCWDLIFFWQGRKQ